MGFSSRRCLFADPSSVTEQPAVGTGEVIADIIEQFSSRLKTMFLHSYHLAQLFNFLLLD